MADSILTSVKKALNIDADDPSFDIDILMHINTVLATLNQIGVGPSMGFAIEDASATWDSLLGSDPRLNSVKTIIYTRVRLIFDPPATSFAITAMENVAQELETRIHTMLEAEKYQAWVAAHPELGLDAQVNTWT